MTPSTSLTSPQGAFFISPKRDALAGALMSAINDRFFNALERRGLRLVPVKWSKEPTEHYIVGGDCPHCHREDASNDSKHVPDRVRVFAIDPSDTRRKKGHYFCRHCKKNGNGVDFIMRYFNLPKSELPAVYEEVTGEKMPDRKGWVPRAGEQAQARPVSTARPAVQPEPDTVLEPVHTPRTFPAERLVQPEPARPRAWEVRPNPLPNVKWLDCAALLAWRLHPALYLPSNPAGLAEARHWIEEDRGINLDFAADCGVFWNPKPISLDRTKCQMWGLNRDWIGVPRGIVIMQQRHFLNDKPYCGAEIVGMQVRLAVPRPDGNRLLWIPWRNDGQDVPGVRSLALGLKGLPVVVTESALDAVLVLQECGGWNAVAVVSPCGASYALDEDAAEWLKEAPELWAFPDADTAGDEAFIKWQTAFPKMRKIEMPKGQDGKPIAKDPTDLARLNRTRNDLPTVRQILKKHGVIDG